MALNGKYISSRELINELYRDVKYKYELPWQDALEWIVSAMELIGAPMALQPKQGLINIANYRGELPCDLHDIVQAAGSFGGCVPFAMTTSTNSFHSVFTCDDAQINDYLIAEAGVNTSITTPIGEDISGNPVYTFQNGDMSVPSTTADTSTASTLNYPTYSLNDNFIFTNYKDGCVFVAYMAMPVDEDGFPLVPDNRRYKEGVKAYVRKQIDYILYRTGELNKSIYDHSEVEWLFYVGSASNSAKMPNRDGMQSLMNQMRLVSQKHAHGNMFKNLGT